MNNPVVVVKTLRKLIFHSVAFFWCKLWQRVDMNPEPLPPSLSYVHTCVLTSYKTWVNMFMSVFRQMVQDLINGHFQQLNEHWTLQVSREINWMLRYLSSINSSWPLPKFILFQWFKKIFQKWGCNGVNDEQML